MATGGRKYPGDETGPALSWISRRMPSRFIQYVSTLREAIFGYHYCFARCRSSLSDPLVWSKTSSAEHLCRAVHTCIWNILHPGYNNGAACSVALAPSSYSISRRDSCPRLEPRHPGSSHEGQLRDRQNVAGKVVGQKTLTCTKDLCCHTGIPGGSQYHYQTRPACLLRAIRLAAFH